MFPIWCSFFFPGFKLPFPEDSEACAAAQEACSCFRRQIFTKQRAKANVSLHKNKEGGKGLWKRCCAAEFIYFFIFINLQRGQWQKKWDCKFKKKTFILFTRIFVKKKRVQTKADASITGAAVSFFGGVTAAQIRYFLKQRKL